MTMAETVTLRIQVRMSSTCLPSYPVTADTADTMATTNSTAQAAVMARIRPKAVPRASMRPVIRPLPEAVAARAAVHLYIK